MHSFIKRLYFFLKRILNFYFLPLLETVFVKYVVETSVPLKPIFIIGAPRCGSTLLMQVISDAFEIGYLNNKCCSWFGAPGIYEKIFRPLKDKVPSDYWSAYGETNKETDPSECGAWWYRFFRREPVYVTSRDVRKRKMNAFRQSIAVLQAVCGCSIVFKNLYASLRLEPIAQYLPEAIYVVMERNLVDNAQSILKGRYDSLGSYDHWWSVPPPDIDKLSKLKPVKQVVGQIESIYSLIEHDIKRLGLEERIFRIAYEDFCSDVHGTLDRFESFMFSLETKLERRFKVPERFVINSSVRLPESMYDELVTHIAERRF